MVIPVSLCAVIGLVAGTLLNLVSQPRIWMALARDGLIPPCFAEIHQTTRTPLNATLLGGAFSLALGSIVPFSVLAKLMSAGTLLALCCVLVGHVALRHQEAQKPPPYGMIFFYLLSIVVCVVSFSYAATVSEQGWEYFFAGCVGLLGMLATGISTACKTPESQQAMSNQDQEGSFILPLRGVVPLFGLFVNVFMLLHMDVNMMVLLIWMVLGVIVYFAYGFGHSKLAAGSGEGRADTTTPLLAKSA